MSKSTKTTVTPNQGKKWRVSGERILALKTVDASRRARGGFVWPESGYVEAPDWKPTQECGCGLHALAWGEGDAELLNGETDALWLVLLVDPAQGYVDLTGKCKFRCCEVLLCGARDAAIEYLIARGGDSGKCVYGTATTGDYGTATAGNRGTATAGDCGTATAGYGGTATTGYGGTATTGYGGTATAGAYGTATTGDRGTATAGDYGTTTTGDRGTATAGDYGTTTTGDYGTATTGDRGTATTGYGGTATTGDYGTATAGDRGTATAGDYGTATTGDRGTATAGDCGTLIFKRWDSKAMRWRCETAYVGENNILPNQPYCCVDGRIQLRKEKGKGKGELP